MGYGGSVGALRAMGALEMGLEETELQPLVEALFCEVNPILVKDAMKMIAYDCGACRLPLGAMSAENRKKLEKILCE